MLIAHLFQWIRRGVIAFRGHWLDFFAFFCFPFANDLPSQISEWKKKYRSHWLNKLLKKAKVPFIDCLLALWKSYRWSWRIKLSNFFKLKKAGIISVWIFSTSLMRMHYPSLSQLMISKYSWFYVKLDLHRGFHRVSEGICLSFSNSFL